MYIRLLQTYIYIICLCIYIDWYYIAAKNKDGSIEDLTVSPAERQTKIKARLKKFFHRRPTMEALVKKGIWKGSLPFLIMCNTYICICMFFVFM